MIAERRGEKKPIARSECTYYCPDEATARRCIDALEESDKRLRERPEELMLWDWQATYFEAETTFTPRARELGCAGVRLYASPDAQPLYTRLGFQPIDQPAMALSLM